MSGRDSHETTGAAPAAGEALGRAARHARAAAGEGLAALRALLDAAARGSGERLAPALERLDTALAHLERGDFGTLAGGLLHALDAEIRRWETRSARDAEARVVLRAFLALREALWDAGLRPAAGPEEPPAGGDAADAPRSPGRRRAQRVPVQG